MENDLEFMKTFVKSIRRDETSHCVDKITFDDDERKKFMQLLNKYSDKKFFVKFYPIYDISRHNSYLIRNMELLDESACKNPYALVYDYKLKKYHYAEDHGGLLSDKYSVEWLFKSGNVLILDPDLIKVYEHFKKFDLIK